MPAGGVYELQCSAWLRKLARSWQSASAALCNAGCPAAPSAPPLPAWQLVNRAVAEDRPAFRACVLEGVAAAMEDLVAVMLQV